LFLPDPTTRVITLPSGTRIPSAGQFSTQQYNALRYLAQLAVNIVDYTDEDDISTVFIWNRNAAGTATFTDLSDVGNRVVFGHEKTRLTINEAYAELVNGPGDAVVPPIDPNTMMPQLPQQPAEARFWVELINPTTVLNPNTGPLGDGSVPLSAYRIQISRFSRGANSGVAANQQGNLNNYLTDPANVTGRLALPTSNLLPDATFTLGAGTVSPNNGSYAPPPAALPANGFVLVGPPAAAKQGSAEFAPNGGVWANMVTSGALADATTSQGMGYTFPLPAANATLADEEFKHHIILLQRLANPYAPPGPTNPPITVDVMDYVPAFDAVHRGRNNGADRGARSANNATGYDPIADANMALNRFSVGRVQPYAGRASATVVTGPGVYNVYSPFPTSMLLKQEPANPVAGQPRHTFGRHNGTADTIPTGSTLVTNPTARLTDPTSGNTQTVQTPFDWLVHLDRPLISTAELLQVRDSAPYRVTDQFVLAATAAPAPAPVPGAGLNYDTGYAPWLIDGYARGLEYLAVKPHGSGQAHGGRVPGRINVNGVPDQRIVTGLFDAPNVNPSASGFDSAWVGTTAWNQWMATRSGLQTSTLPDGTQLSTAAAAGASVFDMNTNVGTAAPLNRPFFSLGAPVATAGGTLAFGGGSNVDQTILRRTPANPNAVQRPILFHGPANNSHAQTEALRKVMNNVTNVNHQYVVFLTISYFDVVGTVQLGGGHSIPELGSEVFINAPGDMRQKVIAVVDMSQMALKAAPLSPTDTDWQATELPFFTSLEQTTYPPLNSAAGPVTLNIAYSRYDTPSNSLYVQSNGQEVAIAQGSKLVLGYGVEEQVVTVQAILGPGQVRVIADNGVFRTAWGGSSVSNVRPGYPGPQPNFAYTDPKYKGVLPYVERVK
jgi:hypothetical protein